MPPSPIPESIVIPDPWTDKDPVTVLWYDGRLRIYPMLPEIKNELTITERALECSAKTRWVRKVTFNKRELFTIERCGKRDIGVTFQGFIYQVIDAIYRSGHRHVSYDMRGVKYGQWIPEPFYNLMYGFRFSQRELVIAALEKNQSGLIGAPTRWGKGSIIANILRAFPTLPAVVATPGADLTYQTYMELSGKDGNEFRAIKGREVRMIKSGKSKPSSDGITVCSMDSLHHCDVGNTRLLIVDEAHAAVTDDRLERIDAFQHARRYGIGATLTGRFDGRDKMILGLFGPILAERTYKEAVAEGAICPLEVIFLRVPLEPDNYYRNRDAAYDELLFCSDKMADITRRICHTIIPPTFQTLVFIRHEKQAEKYIEHIGSESTIAMAKRLSAAERAEVDRLMKANVIKRCLCSKIYVQGVTFSDVRVLINAEAGGNNTSAIQKPGRLAEIRPGKKCGIVIDFLFEPATGKLSDYHGEAWTALCTDSKNRRTAYEEKGYNITTVDTLDELKAKFDTLI